MNPQRGALWSWVSISILALLCGVLGLLQYRSIDAIAAAERSRLYDDLHARLNALSRAFNDEVASSVAALMPASVSGEAFPDEAYALTYLNWKKSHGSVFERIALATPAANGIQLLKLDLATGRFRATDWPVAWNGVRERLMERMRGGRGPAMQSAIPVIEVPLFGNGNARRGFESPGSETRGPETRAPEKGWLLAELNVSYIRGVVLPQLVNKYLSENGSVRYDVKVIGRGGGHQTIYDSGRADLVESNADASAPLLADAGPGNPFGRYGRGPDRGEMWGEPPAGEPPRDGPPSFPRQFGRRGPPPGFGNQAKWLMLVRNRAGSLEALVKQTRRWNLAITTCILAFMLATASVLVKYSRHAQRLADLQINFVAGVSHELRTPLTVIRTAAWNLRATRLRNQPDQVERYGRLIESESAKLEELVEQVLRFASAKAGHIVRSREPVAMKSLMEEEIGVSRRAIEGTGVVLEERIGPELPMVLADATALRQALRNLLDNALKYGVEGGNWVGVYADATVGKDGPALRIRIADRGPGVPRDEQARLFDPFFRGRKAVQDQIHGTGLGLSLVKNIIEAHDGSIQVRSDAANGTEFTICIPAAPAGFQHELTYSAY